MDLLSLINKVSLSSSNDRWICDLNGEGVYRVKDIRYSLDDLLLPTSDIVTRWIKVIPIKINVFVWRARLDRLPTRLHLSKRGVLLDLQVVGYKLERYLILRRLRRSVIYDDIVTRSYHWCGSRISSHLYKAIEESRFLIVIFSQNYASSTWCPRELVILDCKQIENPKDEVWIIFYDAKPDVIRKQKRSYAEAFINHEVLNGTKVDKWKEALSMAADLSGWDLQDMTNGYEYKFIDCISKDILKKICDRPLHVGENLVGIDFHFEKLDVSRFVGSNKVNIIEICGISGIGKTTLAKAIYNLMYIHFEGSCFCEDVKKQQDLTQVQMQLIEKITKTDLKISSVGEGIMVIKKTISSKSILLVLDDVDDHDQVDEIHDMYFLNEDQSLELLRSYAFKEKESFRGFKEAVEEVVKYVQGHPLALKVFGRLLYGKTVGQWVSELDQLKLQIVLVDKSLITISSNNSLRMHDLIQAMASEIIREESNMPGNRRRLWANPSKIYNILSEKKATQAVEILDIQMESSQKFDIDGTTFAQMKNLRILRLSKDDVVNFLEGNIVVIDLSYINIKHF
nr:NB-ARC domains-containing protein [Tanacetum cinerariifolium]